jgi:AraC-like DNA-binding protein
MMSEPPGFDALAVSAFGRSLFLLFRDTACADIRTVAYDGDAMRLLASTDLDLLEQLFEQLADCPFFVKDAELRYVAANTAMAGLCGVRRPRDLYGRRAGDFFPPALTLRYEGLDRQVLAQGRAVTNLLDPSMGAGAESVWLLFSRVPVKTAEGAVAGVAAASRRLKSVDSEYPTYRRLSQVAERLRQRCEEPLRLDELTALAGVSKSQLERDFFRLFALTPSAFLQQARIEKALRLLDGPMTVAQIAYECGYADHSAFTRRFRETVGVTPREHRLRARGGAGA